MPDKKLYEIDVELHMYVMAETEDDARDVALVNLVNEVDEIGGCDLEVMEPAGCIWADMEDSIPYGADDDRRVGDIFEEARQKKRAKRRQREQEKKQRKLFPNQLAAIKGLR